MIPSKHPPAASLEISVDASSVALLLTDINGNLRGKLLNPVLIASERARNQGLPTTDLLLAVDPVDAPITTIKDMGLMSGARDLYLRPDPMTLRPMPWSSDAFLVLGDLLEADGQPCPISPRQVLIRALDALDALGIRLKSAFEFEFRLFKAGTWEPAFATGLSYSPVALSEISDFVATFREYAAGLQLGVTVLHTEGAPGLVEVNVDPQYGTAAADTAVLLRLAAIEAARSHQMHANFMAKPIAGEEGSSAHVHFSMWDEDDRNALRRAATDRDDECYRRAAWGLLKHLPALSVIYNPTINSYKRLVPDFFAPVTATCGADDRSFALRALISDELSSRFELRRPGADCNPYLTLAAIATSLHSGLTMDAPPERDAIDSVNAALPTSLEGAIHEFRKRDQAVDEVLGRRFCQHYLTTREWELHAWQNTVTDWERERYA